MVSVTYPDKKTSSYFFDQNNQLYQICDVSSRWLQMRYDTLGRVYQNMGKWEVWLQWGIG